MESPQSAANVRGCVVFESGPQITGTLSMKYIAPVVTFEWMPEKAGPINVDTMNYEEIPIFFFLHHIKKMLKTKLDNGNVILRFSLNEIRTCTQFVFPPSSQEQIESMIAYLLAQNFISQSQNDATTFNVLTEIEKKFVIPEGKISLSNVSSLVLHRTSTNKLLNDEQPSQEAPITLKEFDSFFDENKKIKDYPSFKESVFKRGLSEEARPHAYMYLLELKEPNLDQIENKEKMGRLTEEFNRILQRWNAKLPEQEKYYHSFHGVIVSDVRRTERNSELFKNEGPAHKVLEEVLVCCAIGLPDTGYTQGMCDLVACLMQIFMKDISNDSMTLYNEKKITFVEGESLIFWAFYGLLKVTCHIELFMDMETNRTFVAERVFALLQKHSPCEARWLSQIEQESLLFTLSPFLLLFKRWFSNSDLLPLWDRLFTQEDPSSYIRFLLASSLMLTFPRLLLCQGKNGDVSTAFNSSLSLINIIDMIRLSNALVSRIKLDGMHTQWIFMKYPSDPPEQEYEPNLITLLD